MTKPLDQTNAIIDRMSAVFDRKVEIGALESLIGSIENEPANIPLSSSTIVLDASAILRIPSHRKAADIQDYLSSQKGRVVLPGQVLQEFWNNQYSVIDTVGVNLQRQFENLSKSVKGLEDIEAIGPGALEEVKQALEKFHAENVAVYHPDTKKRTLSFLRALKDEAEAIVPFAPRSDLSTFAVQRKMVKTPPGFLDKGDGDFFVWSDLLFGLMTLQNQGVQVSQIILVSNDKKLDWCSEGVAHPVLVAEAKTLLNCTFQIWTLDQLALEIAK